MGGRPRITKSLARLRPRVVLWYQPPTRRRVSPGDACPRCHVGRVYMTRGRHGPFLGCTMYRSGGCHAAWTVDGRRLRA
jgi:hypothetical protein